jgi:hypothetical protein
LTQTYAEASWTVRIRRGSDGTPVGGAIPLTLTRVRVLVADAYRLGKRGYQDAGKEAARQLVADALVELELALKSVADAGRVDVRERSRLRASSGLVGLTAGRVAGLRR